METKTRIYLTPGANGTLDAVSESTTFIVLQNVNTLLANAIAEIPVVFPVSIADRIYYAKHRKKPYTILALPNLKLKSTYEVIPGTEVCTPTWGKADMTAVDGTSNAIPQVFADLTWVPPKDVRLWLIHSQINEVWWLVATIPCDDSTKPYECRKLPVGNMFADASLCMGDGFTHEIYGLSGLTCCPHIAGGVRKCLDLITYAKAVNMYLDASTWNSDLNSAEQLQRSSDLFRWNLSDMSQAPVSMDQFLENTWSISGPYEECLLEGFRNGW
jgi:hypothetical protein